MSLTPREMLERVTANLKARTGRTVDEWRALVRRQGPEEPARQAIWLRTVHGLGHVQASVVAELERVDYSAPEKLLDAQYSDGRAALRPIYDSLARAARRLGSDVRVEPCKTYVPLIRRRTFAVIRPQVGRVALGLVLPPGVESDRLSKPGRLGPERLTHKIALVTRDDVDREVRALLRAAYEHDGAPKRRR